MNRGLLLFRRDPLLDQLRLVLGAPSGPISHALVRDAHAEPFLEHLGGESLPCEEEGWHCIRGFTASTDQLRRFPSFASRNRTERAQLIPLGGLRLDRGFLATGAGLPEVSVRGPHTPRAVLMLTPREPLDRLRHPHPGARWVRSAGGANQSLGSQAPWPRDPRLPDWGSAPDGFVR